MPAVMPKSGTRLESIEPPVFAGGVLMDGGVFAGDVLVGGAFAGAVLAGGIVVGGVLLPPGLFVPGLLLLLCRCGNASAVANRANITTVNFMVLDVCERMVAASKGSDQRRNVVESVWIEVKLRKDRKLEVIPGVRSD